MSNTTTAEKSIIPTTILQATGSRLGTNPWPIVLFLGIALLVVETISVIASNSGQLRAVLSRYVPYGVEQQLVYTPRAPALFLGIVALVIVLWWLIAVSVTTSVSLLAGYDRERDTPLIRSVGTGLVTSARVCGYLTVFLVSIAVGLAAVVVPGIYLGIRFFVGVPALVLDDRSVFGAFRESWRRSAGAELSIGLVLAALAVVGAVIWQVPDYGFTLAVTVVAPLAIGASVVTYDELGPNSGPTS